MSKSEPLDDLSKDIVFILGDRQKNPKALYKTWIQFMPHHFYTPTYIFLDSKGNPLLEKVSSRYMHRMFPESRLVSTLEGMLEAHGKGLTRGEWMKLKQRMEDAENAVGEGNPTKGAEILDAIVKANASEVITERAARRRMEILDRIYFETEAKRLEDVEPPTENPKGPSYSDAVDEALLGNFITARDACTALIEQAGENGKDPRIAELLNRINAHTENSIIGGRIKSAKIPIHGVEEPLWEIVITLATKLPNVESLTVQYWALTDQGNVFAGYQTYVNMAPYFRHVISTYLPFSELEREGTGKDTKYEELKDIRYEIYASGKRVAARNLLEHPENEWWKVTAAKRLKFLRDPGWGWNSGARMSQRDRGLVFGKPEVASIEKMEESEGE